MPARDDPHHGASLMYVIGRVDQGVRREMRVRLSPWQLTVSQYTTLSVLGQRPGLSNAQLARRAFVTPQSMVEILRQLERRGLVQRGADSAHALILRAELTTEGRRIVAEADPEVEGIQEAVLAGVPRRQRATALRVMRSAMHSLAEDLHGNHRSRVS